MSDFPITTIPEVQSLATPVPGLLLTARRLIEVTPALQAVFKQSRAEAWDAGRLALAVEEPLQGAMEATVNPQEIVQIARYLADEYQQVGDTLLVISRDTGKAVGRVADEHLWVPPPVPRDDGKMVQPLPRLKPQLEASLMLWHHDREREHQIIAEIAPTLHPTELLRTEGDPRLRPLTRRGRLDLVESLRERLPDLLRQASGSAGQFLTHFEILEEGGDAEAMAHRGQPLQPATAMTRFSTGIQDPKAMNLKFNVLGNLAGRVANGWARELAWALAVAAKHTHTGIPPRPYTSLTTEEKSWDMWVCEPNTADALARRVFERRSSILPVDNLPVTMALRGRVGTIVVKPNSYECRSREVSSRWDVGAKFEYVMWVDWCAVRSFEFEGVPVQAVLARAAAV